MTTLLDPSLFEALLERSCERPMPVVDGVLRMDVTEGDDVEHWYLTMKKGALKVAQDGGEPDCTVSGDRATFEAILSGRANAMAALLRGAIHPQGKVVLLTALQRLFPGSPGARGTASRRLRGAAVMSPAVKILNGNTFVVSDERGDIEASLTDPTGLFSFDTRFLSRWILTVDGQRLNPLSVDDLQYFETRFFLVPGTGTVYIDAKLSVIRQRAISDGFREELTILNHDEEPVDLEVRIVAASDFADLFEVKDDIAKKGEYYTSVDGDRLVLGYRRETYVRETWVSATGPVALDDHGLTFAVHVEPHGRWSTELTRGSRPRSARQRGRARVGRARAPQDGV